MIFKIRIGDKKVINHFIHIDDIDYKFKFSEKKMFIDFGNVTTPTGFQYIDDTHYKYFDLYGNSNIVNMIKKYKRNLVINDILK